MLILLIFLAVFLCSALLFVFLRNYYTPIDVEGTQLVGTIIMTSLNENAANCCPCFLLSPWSTYNSDIWHNILQQSERPLAVSCNYY